MKFSDSLIADIARILQIAILSGTDIVDHLRTFEVSEDDGVLELTSESKSRIDNEITSMLSFIKKENTENEW